MRSVSEFETEMSASDQVSNREQAEAAKFSP